jgi:hypothetical protein
MSKTDEGRRVRSRRFVQHKGVSLRSRYDVSVEFEAMQQAIDLLPAHLVSTTFLSIYCDCTSGGGYTVDTRASEKVAVDLANALSKAFIAIRGGHNGVTVNWGEPAYDPHADAMVRNVIAVRRTSLRVEGRTHRGTRSRQKHFGNG